MTWAVFDEANFDPSTEFFTIEEGGVQKRIARMLASGNAAFAAGGDVEFLITAAGAAGGSGSSVACGGGGGGYVRKFVAGEAGNTEAGPAVVSAGVYPISIGAGGTAAASSTGTNGSNSSALGISAEGGGGGAANFANALPGGPGGGAAQQQSSPGAGNPGGDGGGGNIDPRRGGGGGGAVGDGGNGGIERPDGGAGLQSAIDGTPRGYGGGGGGGARDSAGTSGGLGVDGGGNGGRNFDGGPAAQDGEDGRGGGGGGAGHSSAGGSPLGGDGGDGIVILRVEIASGPEPEPPTGGFKVRQGGQWLPFTAKVRQGGLWTPAIIRKRVSGAWVPPREGGEPGEQYSTDFGEYDIGTPDNWSFHSQGGVTSHHITDNSGLISDRCLRFTHTNNSGTWFGFGATWDDLPDATDVEILMLARRDTLNWLGNFWGGAGRISGADSTLAGLFGGAANNDSDARFARMAAGWSFTAVEAEPHGGTFAAPGNFWFRFRLNGNSYSLKAWQATGAADRGLSDEPGGWLLTGTDSTITAAGKIGFLMRAQAASAGRIELHYFGVGIDGAEAPGPVF